MCFVVGKINTPRQQLASCAALEWKSWQLLVPQTRPVSHWSSLEQTPPPIWQGDDDVQQPDVNVVPLQTET